MLTMVTYMKEKYVLGDGLLASKEINWVTFIQSEGGEVLVKIYGPYENVEDFKEDDQPSSILTFDDVEQNKLFQKIILARDQRGDSCSC